MKLQTKPTVLNNMLAINLDINIWSARRKLNPQDFQHGTLPPEQLASLGSKKICDPKELKIFGTLKSRAVSLLDKTGVRFLGGWGIPEDKAGYITSELQVIADEFYASKSAFMTNYDSAVKNWIKSNPGWETVIQSSVVDASYVSNRIAFNWQTFKVVSPTTRDNKLQTGLHCEVENLGSTLFDEIAKVARDAMNKTFLGKKEVTRKALSPLKTIQSKLSGLSFIEPRVLPVASLIKSAIDMLPSRGAIRGTDLLMLQGLVSLLMQPAAIANYAQEIIDGRSNENVLGSLVQPEKKPTAKTTEAKTMSVAEAPQPAPQLESHGLW